MNDGEDGRKDFYHKEPKAQRGRGNPVMIVHNLNRMALREGWSRMILKDAKICNSHNIIKCCVLSPLHLLLLIVINILRSKKVPVLPRFRKMLEQVGSNIKVARKRRKLTTIQIAERAGIKRSTLYQIERGNPAVSIGAYFNVFITLGLQEDFLRLAADDELGRKLQDLQLLGKA